MHNGYFFHSFLLKQISHPERWGKWYVSFVNPEVPGSLSLFEWRLSAVSDRLNDLSARGEQRLMDLCLLGKEGKVFFARWLITKLNTFESFVEHMPTIGGIKIMTPGKIYKHFLCCPDKAVSKSFKNICWWSKFNGTHQIKLLHQDFCYRHFSFLVIAKIGENCHFWDNPSTV